MNDDASPFFVTPHRFDAPRDARSPVLDRRHELVCDPGEQVLWRGRLRVTGHLLGPTQALRCWKLDPIALVTVTDQRVVYVCAGSDLAVVGSGPRHRRRAGAGVPLVSGQVRWQWPSRLELLADDRGQPAELLIVCDALRTIQQPALGLAVVPGTPGRITELARLVRRAVATFRLAHPTMVELSPPERDVLATRAGTGLFTGEAGVPLPGSLPVEFLTGDDYYQRPGRWTPPPERTAEPERRSALPHRPGSAC
jgi:hypothetical protein